MKRPGFLHGVIVAAVLAFAASIVIAALTPFVGLGTVLRLVIPALGLAYLLYLLGQSGERLGRVTTISLWSALAIATWWMSPTLPLYLLIHVGAVWLVRSLYFYSGVLPALADLGLSALSIAAGMWAVSRTGSAFLATWCFFLVQSLFIVIPASVSQWKKNSLPEEQDNQAFERARRQADQALRQLYS
jgi:hypothetical protein